MLPISDRLRLLVRTIATAGLAMGVAVATLGPLGGNASSHREAPLVAADPQVDTTDVYAFVSPDDPDTVTLIANWIPFEEPAGGPNFYAFGENVRYDIRIDNDGDARPDLTYRWVFDNHYRNKDTFLYNTGVVTSLDDADLNFFQTYDLILDREKGRDVTLLDDAVAVPSDVGAASMPDYAGLRDEGVVSLAHGGGRAFAGQADDPFFLDLRVFDLLYGADFSEAGDDTLAGFNVNTVAIQVPKEALAQDNDPDGNPIIGVWSTTQRPHVRVIKKDGKESSSRRFVQVSRLGMPLVNEVVIPVRDKDRFNASKPVKDEQFLDYVTDPELPQLVEAIYGIPAPATPRDDLVAVFLTGIENLNRPDDVEPSEMIRLNLSIPPCEPGSCPEYSRLGVIGGDTAGYPNGRRLADDTIDISLQVVEGELVGNPNDLSDGVDGNDVPFGPTFPYLALPHRGSDAAPHS